MINNINIMMILLKRCARFCRAKEYISQFEQIQKDILRKETQYAQKRQYLQKLKKIVDADPAEYFFRYAKMLSKNLLGGKYDSHGFSQQSHRQQILKKQYREEIEKTDTIMAKNHERKKQELQKMETSFLIDLLRFSGKYQKVVKETNFSSEIKAGLDLSCKTLDNVLQKEGLQWIHDQEDKFNEKIHERINQDNTGQKIDTVINKGIKIKDRIISKAKVSTKKQEK